MPETILVTGGAGYIGTHTCVALLEAGYEVVIIDNLINSRPEAVRRVEAIAGRAVTFYADDLLDAPAVQRILHAHPIDAVIHFAGLKAVGESCRVPLRYYHNNLQGTVNLLEAMQTGGCHRLVFSSSATVYGAPDRVPVTEDVPLQPTNPYGRTKFFIEEILRDCCRADPSWSVLLLRYFNPVGAHASGAIGEDPTGVPNNLLPSIAQVAVGRRERVQIFGDDYPTPDGTGVRDYIHVVDLAEGHLAALRALPSRSGCTPINLGTGHGSSVLEMIHAFENASGRKVPYEVVARRPGDVAVSYADPGRARRELGWQTERDLATMCADSWRWQSRNPQGYAEA